MDSAALTGGCGKVFFDSDEKFINAFVVLVLLSFCVTIQS